MLWKLPNISLAPDVIIPLFADGNGITNTLLCTWLSIIVLAVFFYFGTRNKGSFIPTRFQAVVEMMVEYLLGLVDSVVGDKEKGRKFFPLVATFFIFILTANLLDIFPGVDTIGQVHITHALNNQPYLGIFPQNQPLLGIFLFGDISNQMIPWIRPATSDLNLTFAMALVSVITCQVFGFVTLGPKEHLFKYFNFPALRKGGAGIIEFVVGLIEIVSEVARIISFSFRLFGNIFAGSILLAVFGFLLPFVSTIIFIPFELFVAGVQALVFALLTLVFLEIATTSHEAHADPHSEHGAQVDLERGRAQEEAVAAHS